MFQGERCEDDKFLRDYGICHDFIKQVERSVHTTKFPICSLSSAYNMK